MAGPEKAVHDTIQVNRLITPNALVSSRLVAGKRRPHQRAPVSLNGVPQMQDKPSKVLQPEHL